LSYPKYRAAGIIVGNDWDALVRTVLNYGKAKAVVGFNSNLSGRENYFLCDGTADDVQIQAALDYLTAGRTWKETVILEEGMYNVVASIDIPSYTVLEVRGRIEKGFVGNVFTVAGTIGTHRTDIEVKGGIYDGNDGIYADANSFFYPTYTDRMSFIGLEFIDVHDYGIRTNAGTTTDILVTECYATGCAGLCHMDIVTIFRVINNSCYHNDIDIRVSGGREGLVNGNVVIGDESVGGGITLVGNSRYCEVIGNSVAQKGLEGIAVEQSDYCSVIGNTLFKNFGGGIKSWDCNYNLFEGNLLIDNYCQVPLGPGSDAPLAAQLAIYNADPAHQSYYNVVRGNYIIATGDFAPVPEYGIGEFMEGAAGPVNFNTYFDNRMDGHSVSPILIVGADTILRTMVIPFVNGNEATDHGYLIDAVGEIARTYFLLKTEIQWVWKLKVDAISRVLEADSMMCQFAIWGGTENNPFNQHDCTATWASRTANFAANDVIIWERLLCVTNFLPEESISVRAVHAAADAANCETNADFRSVTIAYV